MKSLLSSQTDALDHLSRWKVGALFMEAGTGKTRVAMEIVNASPCDLVVWIGPLRTLDGKGSVREEIAKWGGFKMQDAYFGAESISGSSRIYLNLLALIKTATNPFIVVDESLKFKNSYAVRTKRLMEVSQMAQYKLILNGTPISRNLLDLYPQMNFLSPQILSMTEAQFKNTFVKYTKMTRQIYGKRITREWINGYENIDYLYSLIRHYVFRCDLSLRISSFFHELRYNISEDEKYEYNEIKRIYLDDEMMELKNNNIFLEMTSKMQHLYCCTEDKFRVVDKLFETVNQATTIIFCRFVRSREECAKRYPKARVLSYQSESFGLNLQDYSTTIYFDKIWDYALRTQASRRTFRTGQESDCQYYDLTGDVKLEELIDKNINKKIGMLEYFKGKTKEEINQVL